jgi:hypothetical protein
MDQRRKRRFSRQLKAGRILLPQWERAKIAAEGA